VRSILLAISKVINLGVGGFMKKNIAILFVIGLTINGCTTSYQLHPIVSSYSNDIEIVFLEGNEVALSVKDSTAVAIFGQKNANNELYLYVAYKNKSVHQKANAIPSDIVVYGINEIGSKKQFQTYSAYEYLKRMKSQQAIVLGLQAAAGIVESTNSAQSTTYTSGTYSSSDGTSLSGSSVSTTYDYSKQAEVDARNQKDLQESIQQYKKVNSATEQGLIKKTTLFPGQMIEGYVVVKMDNYYSKGFLINVPIGQDVHEYRFVPGTY